MATSPYFNTIREMSGVKRLPRHVIFLALSQGNKISEVSSQADKQLKLRPQCCKLMLDIRANEEFTRSSITSS